MSEIETITSASRIPVLSDKRHEKGAQPSLCQGWLCHALSDSYGSAPAPSGGSLGSMGACPIHSWY